MMHKKELIAGKLWKPHEVADRLGVAVSTVWEWCRKNKITNLKMSRRDYRISEAAVEEFLLAKTRVRSGVR